jgi:hypothetical protein
VEVQALYYGSDWSTNATYRKQASALDGFLHDVVNSSYMDMLSKAGYGVGRGSATPGVVAALSLYPNSWVDDSQLQQDLQTYISNGSLEPPDANRLYVIYVEDNIVVTLGDADSVTSFLGYHSAFAGHDALNNATDIHYAVITYPGGRSCNAGIPGLSAVNDMTMVTSHELAEGVTDPNVNYKTLGWYDDAQGGEVGDLAIGKYVFLNGHAVQRIVDQNDFAMTPAWSVAATNEQFILKVGGKLYKHTSAGLAVIFSGVASLTDQAIDYNGQVMADFVTTTGEAYEYHEGGGTTNLGGGVVSAVAGQGVSYLLYSDGSVYEYDDINGLGTSPIATGAAAISAGTDKEGVNRVDILSTTGDLTEYSDTSGAHNIASGVKQMSAGLRGITDYVLTTGDAYKYSQAGSGSTTFLASGVAMVSAGTAPNGSALIDLVYSNGNLSEFRASTGWVPIAIGVQSVRKGRLGVVDAVFTSGNASAHNSTGWSSLANGVLTIA